VADADRLSACKLKCLAANSTAKSGLRTGSRRQLNSGLKTEKKIPKRVQQNCAS